MPHGLTSFKASDVIEKAQSALQLMESALEQGGEANLEATQESLRIALENQVAIVETLDLIKKEFDKFEEGLGKIL